MHPAKSLIAGLLLSLTACLPAQDGYPVFQAEVAGHTLSCKGAACCYPWTHDGLAPCVKVEYPAGVLLYLRGH
jgi:hypothetical protein